MYSVDYADRNFAGIQTATEWTSNTSLKVTHGKLTIQVAPGSVAIVGITGGPPWPPLRSHESNEGRPRTPAPTIDYTVIVVPSNLVKLKPLNTSL